MLYPALQYLNLYLGQFVDSSITIELAPVPSREQVQTQNDSTEKVLYISLLNVEEDRTHKDPYSIKRNTAVNPAMNTQLNPEMRFYLYVMFTSYCASDYKTSLNAITSVITAFANQNYFSGNDLTAPWTSGYSGQFSDSFSQLAVDLYTISLDQSSNMWQAMSSNILPNVIYKIRMLSIVPTLTVNQAGDVRDVNLNTITIN